MDNQELLVEALKAIVEASKDGNGWGKTDLGRIAADALKVFYGSP